MSIDVSMAAGTYNGRRGAIVVNNLQLDPVDCTAEKFSS